MIESLHQQIRNFQTYFVCDSKIRLNAQNQYLHILALWALKIKG